MTDQSIINSLDDNVQQLQATETKENQVAMQFKRLFVLCCVFAL